MSKELLLTANLVNIPKIILSTSLKFPLKMITGKNFLTFGSCGCRI